MSDRRIIISLKAILPTVVISPNVKYPKNQLAFSFISL